MGILTLKKKDESITEMVGAIIVGNFWDTSLNAPIVTGPYNVSIAVPIREQDRVFCRIIDLVKIPTTLDEIH